MSYMLRSTAVIAALTLVSACQSGEGGGTVFTPSTTQSITVTSAPTDASCWVQNDSTKLKLTTPETVTVVHSSPHSDNLKVFCKKGDAIGSVSLGHTDGTSYPSNVHIVAK